ncbi:MAG: hypothetical protein WC238_00835 [Parcubacteria group bacterium]|jgi:hypothetical protein
MFKTKTKKEKIDYKAEIDAMKKDEIERCKKECEVCNNRRSYNSNAVAVMFLIVLTVFMVGTILYAVYAFVHVTRISDLAGVHVTPAIRKATNSLMNEGGVEERMRKTPGYENWLVYHNDLFAVMYLPDWEVKVDGGVVFKKYNNRQIQRFDSLAMSVVFGTLENPDNLPLEQILKDNHRAVGKKPIYAEVAGKGVLRTGKISLDSGLTAESVYWPLEQKVFYMEAVHFDKKTTDCEKDFQKMLDSVNFL